MLYIKKSYVRLVRKMQRNVHYLLWLESFLIAGGRGYWRFAAWLYWSVLIWGWPCPGSAGLSVIFWSQTSISYFQCIIHIFHRKLSCLLNFCTIPKLGILRTNISDGVYSCVLLFIKENKITCRHFTYSRSGGLKVQEAAGQ